MKRFRLMLAAFTAATLLTSTAALAQPSYSCGSCSWEYLRCIRAGIVDESVCYARYEECMAWNACIAS